MKKLHQLKSEFTINQAAERLSTSFEEIVNEADIYELCLEGNLQTCWRVTQSKAVEVLYSTRLVDWFGGGGTDPSRSNLLDECDERGVGDTPIHRGFFEEFAPCDDFISTLDGTFAIDLQHSDLEAWLLGLARKHSLYDKGTKPVILRDSKGRLWKIMERKTQEPIDYENMNDENMWQEGLDNYVGYYHPDSTRPDPSELVILRSDIEALEKSFDEQAGVPNGGLRNLHPRLEASYQRIIGAMLELLLDERGITSQNALINKMLLKHDGKDGFSKSKLENVFAAANQALKS